MLLHWGSKAVVLATAATVLAVPLFSNNQMTIYIQSMNFLSTRRSMIYINTLWACVKMAPLIDRHVLKKYPSYLLLSINHLGLCFPNDHLGKLRLFIDRFRSCGSRNGHSFQHYDEAKDVAFYHTCVTAVKLKKIRAPNAELTYTIFKLIKRSNNGRQPPVPVCSQYWKWLACWATL